MNRPQTNSVKVDHCQNAFLRLSFLCSLPNTRTVPLSPLSKTCALICLSHTVGIPIEILLTWDLSLGKTRSRRSWSLIHTHIHATKEWADRSGFHYREKKGKGSSSHFIPYEGHIPEHAALLPQETWGNVGGVKEGGRIGRKSEENKIVQGENGRKAVLINFSLLNV